MFIEDEILNINYNLSDIKQVDSLHSELKFSWKLIARNKFLNRMKTIMVGWMKILVDIWYINSFVIDLAECNFTRL